MFRNYLKIAFRSFLFQKYYSIINTVGLALGTSACILMLLFVEDEVSYRTRLKRINRSIGWFRTFRWARTYRDLLRCHFRARPVL